ncbi:hypothetical protein I4U23_008345 [Adineta vaga]|nr:hypothetical protein I4U23_008345 [Adineta vaga]
MINFKSCSAKKSKPKPENYVIDLLFTNSLTIIRCNPYERHVIRDISIEKLGYIKCSNRDSFLPENHLEKIALLEWRFTETKCKNSKITETTYLNIKHRPKKVYKDLKLHLTRLGSVGGVYIKEVKKTSSLYFENIGGKSSISNTENFTTVFYAFTERPILCRERYPASKNPCLATTQKKNFSYTCYYRIGDNTAPSIADMEIELKSLLNNGNSNEDSIRDVYINKTPEEKPSQDNSDSLIIGLIILIIVIVIFSSISIYFCCCRRRRRRPLPSPRRRAPRRGRVSGGSDTSIATNTS